MTTMIALIGEQQLPNFLPVRHFSPSNVLLVYTEKTQPQYENLQEELPDYISLLDMLELHLGKKKDRTGKERWIIDEPTTSSDGGHLFELAIKQALQGHGYEALCGVKNHTNQVDIDVMIRYKNQVAILEAKTGSSTDLRGVKQLSYAIRYLGGT